MTSKKIIERALENAKTEESHDIESVDELKTEDLEFKKEAKELKDLLESFGKKI